MNYQQTIDYLFSRLPSYQTQGKQAYKADLSNTIALCRILGNPEKNLKSIHVAGTNGKGSTCHMLASIYQEAGYKVGIYSSPHLKDFRERVKINGKMILESEVINFVEKYKEEFEKLQLSFFEWTTGLAFYYFAKQKVDLAIIETGLGGRLDSTNVITPLISIITNIGLDHINILGNSLEAIAKEKAGIIKYEIPIVIGEKNESLIHLFKEIAETNRAPIYLSENHNYASDLKGIYQIDNINTAVSAIKILHNQFPVKDEEIVNGLKNVSKNTNLKGRWQILSESPKIIADVAHNIDGIKTILKQISLEKHNQLHIVIGMAKDKEINSILKILPKKAHYYFCQPNNPRCISSTELKEIAESYNLIGNTFASVNDALETAIKHSKSDDFILVGGSNFVVAEIIP